MIEIPKYSIGTFNPNALEENRRSEEEIIILD